jgi:DNA-binding transcriptional MocR family regulator
MLADSIQNYDRFLTPLSKAREPSAIRALQPLMATPGMLSLAGGLPNPTTFPIASLTMTLKSGKTISLDENKTKIALQYGPTPGNPDLVKYFKSVQSYVHGETLPGSCPREISIGNGSQDLLAKAISALVSPGDALLVESPCYVGTLAILKPLARTMGIRLISVPADGDGIIPKELDFILSNWDVKSQGSKPRVLYTVPTGGNPTGGTAPLSRRKAVYGLLQKYDLLLMEDDPYYYLQFVKNPGKAKNAISTKEYVWNTEETNSEGAQFLKQLIPSYLSMDVDGRVLRFESLSKVLSAGIRLGIVTGPKPLIERIQMDMQATALQPSGVAQALVLALSEHEWNSTPLGFLAHASRIAAFYGARRDSFVKALNSSGLVDEGLVEYQIPQAGMFVWLKLKTIADSARLVREYAAARKVLLLPGSEFIPPHEYSKLAPNCDGSVMRPRAKEPTTSFVRATYSTATDEDMAEALLRLRECIILASKDMN